MVSGPPDSTGHTPDLRLREQRLLVLQLPPRSPDSRAETRDDITADDAMYIAMAEAHDAPIVTCDAPLATAPGHRAHIAVIA